MRPAASAESAIISSIGFPQTVCSDLGFRDFILVPLPAASITEAKGREP